MARTITLKYKGKCYECSSLLKVGDSARYYGYGRVYGIKCHERNVPTKTLEDTLEACDALAKSAHDNYFKEYYKQPVYDVKDGQATVAKMFDVCGFVWLEVSYKEGKKLIRDFKQEGVKQGNKYSHDSRDKEWVVGDFRLSYNASSSRWSSPWGLYVRSVGYGNGSMGAMEEAGNTFTKALEDRGYAGVRKVSRID